MLVIPKRYPLGLRHLIGIAIFMIGFVGSSSLLHTYAPRADVQSDVVSKPKDGQKKEDIPTPVTVPAVEATQPNSTPPTYVYKPAPVKPQPVATSVVQPENPSVVPAENPPATEQPPEQPPEEPAPPEEPVPEEPIDPVP